MTDQPNFGDYEPDLPEPPSEWFDETSGYIQENEEPPEAFDNTTGPRVMSPTDPDYIAGTKHEDEGSYPFLTGRLNWRLETFKYILGGEGNAREAHLEKQNPTLRIGRGSGSTDIYIMDAKGQTVDMNRFLKATGLSIRPKGNEPASAKTMKRLSRVFRKSYAWGFLQKSEFPITEFDWKNKEGQVEKDPAVWDALAMVGPDVIDRITAKMPEAQRAEYLHAGRFEATIMDKAGQWKGHFIVNPDITGIHLPSGSWKKEIAYDSEAANQGQQYFLDVRPKHFRSGDLNVDPQTYTNLYRYIVPNEQFTKWLEQKTSRFLENAKKGITLEDAERLFFQGIESQEQFDSRMKMPLFEFLARGGDIRQSPEMMKQYVDMYKQKISKKAGHFALPMPTAFSMYLTSAVGLKDWESKVKKGQVYLDEETSAAYVHPDEYKDIAARMGGGDQDDQLLLNYTKSRGKNEIIGNRRPNTQGEYWIWELANPDFIERNKIKALDIKAEGLNEITQVNQKHFTYDDEHPLPDAPWKDKDGNVLPPAKDFNEYATRTMKRARTFMTDLGRYINAMTAMTLIAGREVRQQAAPSEYIIDRLQKELSPLGPIWDEIGAMASRAQNVPMPREAWRRLHSIIPKESRKEGFIPAPNHPFDMMAGYIEQHLEYIEQQSKALQNIAAPTDDMAERYGKSRALAGRLTGAYLKNLEYGEKTTPQQYRKAYESLRETMLKMNRSDRDTAIMQLFTTPFQGRTKEEFHLEDSILWLKRKETDGGPSVSDMTFAALERAGYLNKKPTFGQPMEPTNSTGIPTHELLIGPTNVNLGKLMNKEVSIENTDEGAWVVSDGQRIVPLLPQHGRVSGAGKVTWVDEKSGKGGNPSMYALRVQSSNMDVEFESFKYQVPKDHNRAETALFRNLSLTLGKMPDESALSATGKWALRAIDKFLRGNPVERPTLKREYFDPNEGRKVKTYSGRQMGHAPRSYGLDEDYLATATEDWQYFRAQTRLNPGSSTGTENNYRSHRPNLDEDYGNLGDFHRWYWQEGLQIKEQEAEARRIALTGKLYRSSKDIKAENDRIAAARQKAARDNGWYKEMIDEYSRFRPVRKEAIDMRSAKAWGEEFLNEYMRDEDWERAERMRDAFKSGQRSRILTAEERADLERKSAELTAERRYQRETDQVIEFAGGRVNVSETDRESSSIVDAMEEKVYQQKLARERRKMMRAGAAQEQALANYDTAYEGRMVAHAPEMTWFSRPTAIKGHIDSANGWFTHGERRGPSVVGTAIALNDISFQRLMETVAGRIVERGVNVGLSRKVISKFAASMPTREFVREHEIGHYAAYLASGANEENYRTNVGIEEFSSAMREYPRSTWMIGGKYTEKYFSDLARKRGVSIEEAMLSEEFADQHALFQKLPEVQSEAFPSISAYFGKRAKNFEEIHNALPPVYSVKGVDNYSIDTPGGDLSIANKIIKARANILAGRMIAKAPPQDFFKLPFEPQFLPGLAVHEENGEKWYGLRAPTGAVSQDEWRDFYSNMEDMAKRAAGVLFMGKTPDELAQMDIENAPSSVRMDYLKRFFGGGEDMSQEMGEWVNRMPEAARRQFEWAYVGTYSEYLFKKSRGNDTRNTQWAQYWNAFSSAHGLSFPQTWHQKNRGFWDSNIPEPPEPPDMGGPADYGPPPPPDDNGPLPPPPDDDDGNPNNEELWQGTRTNRYDPVSPDHPYYQIYQNQTPNKQLVRRNALANRNTAIFTPPGSGKTEYMKQMALTMGGIGIVVTPLNELNKNLAQRITDDTEGNIRGIYLPGHPGRDRDDTEYKRQMRIAREAVRNGQRAALIMSPEKFSNFASTSFGRSMIGNVSWMAIDEAQEFGAYVGREMMTTMPDAIKKIQGQRERMPLLMMGGTVDLRQEWGMRRAYKIDDVIREPVTAPHVNFELFVPRNESEYADDAVKFARESGRHPALIYGFSTRLVENISDAINASGQQSLYFHRGQGARGRYMTDEELKRVTDQINDRERGLQQHLVASSALGMGLDMPNITRVASYGPARIDEIIQRALRARPNKYWEQQANKQATFRMVATPQQYKQWADEYSADMNALNPKIVSDAFENARRQDYSLNWKDASDQIAKQIGKFVHENYKMNENRGADIAAIMRQAGLLRMEVKPVKVGTDEETGEELWDNVQIPVFQNVSDARKIVSEARYRDPYDLVEDLTFNQYTKKIGEQRSKQYTLLSQFLRKVQGMDPKKAGLLFKDAITKVYGGRMEAQAPKAGLEAIGVRYQTGDGEEKTVYSDTFSGTDQSEVHIVDYARAVGEALRSGGTITGSYHTHPTGRTDKMSEADKSLEQLGEVKVQEADYTTRMMAQADPPPPVDPNGPPPPDANDIFEEAVQDVGNRAGEIGGIPNLRNLINGMQNVQEIMEKAARAMQQGGQSMTEMGKLQAEAYKVLKPIVADLAEQWGATRDAGAKRAFGEQVRGMAAEYDGTPVSAALRGIGNNMIDDAERAFARGDVIQEQQQPPQGPPGGSGKAYRLAYGMAMAHRMWNIAAAPVFQEAGQYASQDFLAPGLIGKTQSGQYGMTQSGFAARQEIVSNMSGRGAYEQWGGVMDLPYAFSDTNIARAGSRIGAATKVGVGLMASMVDFGWQLGMMGDEGMKSLGKSLGRAGMVAGVGVPIASGVMELANTGMFGFKPAEGDEFSFGNVARSIYGAFQFDSRIQGRIQEIADQNGLSQWDPRRLNLGVRATLMSLGTSGQRRKLLESLGIQWDETDPGDQYALGGKTKDEIDTEKRLERLVTKTGSRVDATEFTSAMSLIGNKQATEDFIGQFRKFGFQNANQFTSTLEQIGSQFGYRPGSAEYLQLASQLQNMKGPEGLWAMQNQAQRVGQFAGYLAPIMGYSNAAQYVMRYDMNTSRRAQTAEGVLDKLQSYSDSYAAPSLPYFKPSTNPAQPAQLAQPPQGHWTIGGAFSGTFKGALSTPDISDAAMDAWGVSYSNAEAGFMGRTTPNSTQAFDKSLRMPNGDRIDSVNIPPRKKQTYFPGKEADDLIANQPVYVSGKNGTEGVYGAWQKAFSQSQLDIANQILGGDLNAASYAAWNDPTLIRAMGLGNPDAYKINNQYGQPITTSGRDWIKFQNAQAVQGNVAADANANVSGIQLITPTSQGVQNFINAKLQQHNGGKPMDASYGIRDQGLIGAFLSGDTNAVDWYTFNQQWSFQQRGFGLQQQQLDASRAYTGQMNAFQDQQRAMQYKNTMADFAYSKQRMETSNRFAQDQEGISWARLTIGQEQQKWMTAFNYQTNLMQRGWQREDWQYQDQTRQMQFGWNMEDINEAIRYSTGRDRRKLVRQRDRLTTTQGMEDQQIDNQRERQEKLWGREDERYKKEMEYADELMKLDIKQFDLNKRQREELYEMEKGNLARKVKEYQDEFALQTKIEEAQRDYQEIQMEFQQQSLDLSKEQAQLAHDVDLLMKGVNETYSQTVGVMSEAAKYKPEQMIQKFADMLKILGSVDPSTLSSMNNVFTRMSQLTPTQLNAIANALT